MIVAGFGFRKATALDSLIDVYARACGPHRPDAIATADDKSRSDVFQSFAKHLALPIAPIAASDLTHQTVQTQSTASQNTRKTGSVAEAAALAAAGPGAHLLGARIVSSDQMATCALAMSQDHTP